MPTRIKFLYTHEVDLWEISQPFKLKTPLNTCLSHIWWLFKCEQNMLMEISSLKFNCRIIYGILSSLTKPSCANFTLALEFKDTKMGVSYGEKESSCELRLNIIKTWRVLKFLCSNHTLNQINQNLWVGPMHQYSFKAPQLLPMGRQRWEPMNQKISQRNLRLTTA